MHTEPGETIAIISMGSRLTYGAAKHNLAYNSSGDLFPEPSGIMDGGSLLASIEELAGFVYHEVRS